MMMKCVCVCLCVCLCCCNDSYIVLTMFIMTMMMMDQCSNLTKTLRLNENTNWSFKDLIQAKSELFSTTLLYCYVFLFFSPRANLFLFLHGLIFDSIIIIIIINIFYFDMFVVAITENEKIRFYPSFCILFFSQGWKSFHNSRNISSKWFGSYILYDDWKWNTCTPAHTRLFRCVYWFVLYFNQSIEHTNTGTGTDTFKIIRYRCWSSDIFTKNTQMRWWWW